MTKFTFKRDKRDTGLMSITQIPGTTIKIKGKFVGRINGPNRERNGWRISFMIVVVPTKEKPAPFRWIMLGKQFATEGLARMYLDDHYETVIKQWELYHAEPYE